jgi:hypothetical protein
MEKRMRQSENSWSKFSWGNVSKLAAVGLMLTLWCSIPSAAQQRGQKTFSSPEEASNTLFTAMQSNDEKALLEILGPDAKQIVSSGDEAEDSNNRAMFVKKYQELHRLVTEPDGHFIYRRRKLAHPDTARGQRFGLVFRHGRS